MTYLLDQYLKKIEQDKEKSRQQALKKVHSALKEISESISFKQAYIFGSVLKKKKFYYDSDVDIAVEGLDNKDFFEFMAKISDLLNREVDVIQIENHRLKKKILKEALLWRRPK